jgi:mannose-6-phosphate isomerase-like protein (cupin superfamily)
MIKSKTRASTQGLMVRMSPRDFALLAALIATHAAAQGRESPVVRTPNEGNSRVYLGTPDEALEASVQAAAGLGLEVTRAPDGTVFIASPTSWTQAVENITFTRTFVVRVRTLNPKETEVSVDEESRGRDKDPYADKRVSLFHERIAAAVGELRPKKVLIPKHPQEIQAEPTLVKQADLLSMRPAEDSEALRAWNLGYARVNPVNTVEWKLKGDVPLHFTPLSERRLLVMEGSARIAVGTRTFWISAGDFVVVPKGVRTRIWLEKEARATLFVVETPAVDDSKTVWLEGKGDGKAGQP